MPREQLLKMIILFLILSFCRILLGNNPEEYNNYNFNCDLFLGMSLRQINSTILIVLQSLVKGKDNHDDDDDDNNNNNNSYCIQSCHHGITVIPTYS